MPSNTVKAWVENINIPTYPAPLGDLNPLFLERRNNQGATGRIYPNAINDYVNTKKINQTYEAVFIENEYIQLIILPQLGGRIFGALDKTNGVDFFYRQHVIKPALIGLFGSWISGGAEFNWPQHHRPSTFMPVDFIIEAGSDGSQTVWLSEHEPTQRMKGMLGVCLYPSKALVETKVRLYNRTPYPQTFLFWENIAVSVNDQYQIFFPPDVTHVVFHSKHEMAHYPVAREVYCGFDLTRGVDISWHRNSAKAASYFAGESTFDFFGGYDHGKKAGLIHIGNHHISPGKKLFTWGNDEFSKVWEQNLTDADGPYAELMAGSYTDNQPDFSWLRPYESKSFSQFWYPFHEIGTAKQANCQVAVNLTVENNNVTVGIYVTEPVKQAKVSLSASEPHPGTGAAFASKILLERETDLAPGSAYRVEIKLPLNLKETDLTLRICTANGDELLAYNPQPRIEKPLPTPANPPLAPNKIDTLEGLYLTGLHVEQYLHPVLDPDAYWHEALRREPGDSRSNNALGRLLLRRGVFAQAETYLRTAIQTLTRLNGHPYDGEPFYNLGLALRFQHRFDEAYAAFYKAIWSYTWQSAGYYALAELAARRGDYKTALAHAENACADRQNQKAHNLKAALLRHLGRYDEALALTGQTQAQDPLDFWARNENMLAYQQEGQIATAERQQAEITSIFRTDAQQYLDVAFDYANAGLWADASNLLAGLLKRNGENAPAYPMVLYVLGYCAFQSGQAETGRAFYQRAAQAPADYCFPVRLEELEVLTHVRATRPNDARAAYYLGNLLYDKKQYEPAIENWQEACKLDPDFSISWRNLGLACFNVRHDAAQAKECYQRALKVNPNDHRVFYELILLCKRMAVAPAKCLALLESRLDLVAERDPLYLEHVTLYNDLKQPQKALDLLLARRFYPWEGLEGLIADQYALAHLMLGRQALEAGNPQEALAHFEAGWHFPLSLGVGRWCAISDIPCQYYGGVALDQLGQQDAAQAAFKAVVSADDSDWSLGFLPSLPYYKALALQSLGRPAEANQKLGKLLASATAELNNPDYCEPANSQPFNQDAQKLKRVQQTYLLGLAHLGLGHHDEAQRAFQEVIALDPYHPLSQ